MTGESRGKYKMNQRKHKRETKAKTKKKTIQRKHLQKITNFSQTVNHILQPAKQITFLPQKHYWHNGVSEQYGPPHRGEMCTKCALHEGTSD